MKSSENSSVALTLTLFGPMQVLIEGQPLPRLRSQKALWLLALLILRHGRPVEREWLAETLWPDADPVQASASLRPVLSELRKALGAEGKRLESPGHHTLRLALEGADVDVLRFDAAISSGSSGQLKALELAAALYQGPLLEGCAEEWVAQERGQREQDCLRALLLLAEDALTGNNLSTAADYFQRAVVLDPWRDAARRGLMKTLAQSGNVNAALQVYREFVALLRDDPKAAPDAQTQALYQRLRSETRRQAAAPVAAAPYPASPLPGNLPHALTDLVGREEERQEAVGILQRSRLMTLTGLGGIGKTRLAIAVAEAVADEFSDGVWLVALEALSDQTQIPGRIASILGVKEEPNRTAQESLCDHLRAKRLLLVLDNCEHLLEASARTAGHLLRECAGLRVLATSRVALGITGEAVWAVPGLPVPDLAHLPPGAATLTRVLAGYESVQLFVERARSVQQAFALTPQNALAVAQVCARLEGIPLALELAAARVRVMTMEQIAARLNDHLSLLIGGDRAGPLRQQTLRATLDWSYALLSVPEKLLLARASVFVGGWTLDAAEAVCSGEGVGEERVLDLLTGLVGQSLVVFEENGAGSGRCRMLEMVRQYVAERLAGEDKAERVSTRLRDWLLGLAEEAARHRAELDPRWWRPLAAEADNLRAILDWSEAQEVLPASHLRLTGLLAGYWELRGEYSQARQYLARALERDAQAPPTADRATALNAAALLAFRQGDYLEARRLHEQGLSLWRVLGNYAGAAASMGNLGNTELMLGGYEAAQSLYEESLSIRRELGDRKGIAFSLENLGVINSQQGEFAAAGVRLAESLSIRRSLGDTLGVAQALSNLGNLALAQEDYLEAQINFEECLRLFRELEVKYAIAWSLNSLGSVVLLRGNPAWARTLYEEGLALYQEIGEQPGIAESLASLGRVVSQQGEHTIAQQLYRQGLRIYRHLGHKLGVENTLSGLASVLVQTGSRPEMEKAVSFWGSASSLRQEMGLPVLPNEQAEHEQQTSKARAALGDAVFKAAWEQGSAGTWEEAAAYALAEQ